MVIQFYGTIVIQLYDTIVIIFLPWAIKQYAKKFPLSGPMPYVINSFITWAGLQILTKTVKLELWYKQLFVL